MRPSSQIGGIGSHRPRWRRWGTTEAETFSRPGRLLCGGSETVAKICCLLRLRLRGCSGLRRDSIWAPAFQHAHEEVGCLEHGHVAGALDDLELPAGPPADEASWARAAGRGRMDSLDRPAQAS